jgi:hypothetical protein
MIKHINTMNLNPSIIESINLNSEANSPFMRVDISKQNRITVILL